MPTLEITIAIPDEWPTGEELDGRNAVEDEFDAAELGVFLGAGGGMSQMDLAFDVEPSNVAAARKLIAQAMETHLPGYKYELSEQD